MCKHRNLVRCAKKHKKPKGKRVQHIRIEKRRKYVCNVRYIVSVSLESVYAIVVGLRMARDK